MKKRWLEILLHLLFWWLSYWGLTILLSFESMEIIVEDDIERRIYTQSSGLGPFYMINIAVKMLLFYTNAFFLLPQALKSKKWIRYLGGCLVLLLICLGLEWGMLELSRDAGFFPATELSKDIFPATILLNSVLYFFYLITSFAYRFGKEWWHNERQRAKLARERLTAELNYLKSQINPHFLFNTLNNLYAIAERNEQEELSRGITELSTLMRYMLYECKADRVPLEKEIAYLKSIIEIHQLRLSPADDVMVVFNIKGDYKGKMIAPLLLAPFLENAFKHGINTQEASFIKVDFVVQEDQLFYEVTNSNFKDLGSEHNQHSGIGLENVKRRLALIYPDQHQLEVEEKEETFKVRLVIVS